MPPKKIAVVIGLVIALVSFPALKIKAADDNTPRESLIRTAEQATSDFVDFKFLPGSAIVIDGRYILALYENSENGLYALAMFTAHCDVDDCAVEELIAYSILDAPGGFSYTKI